VSTLLQRADVAMYEAKSAHGRFAVYDPEHHPNHPERLALIAQLRRAIANDELVLHYQPKAVVGSGEVRSVEALVRWQHPERGLLPPGEFIPIAQRTGLITPLTRWVLNAALAQSAEWQRRGLPLA